MKLRQIVCIICAVCIVTAAAFSATAVYAYDSADIIKLTDDIISFSIKDSESEDINQYIDGYLAKNAAVLSEWMVIALSRTDAGYDFSSYVDSLKDYLKKNEVPSASKRLLYSLSLMCAGAVDEPYIGRSVNDSIGELGIMSYIFGLHMINNGYRSDKFTADDIISTLLSLRLEDGGWALFGKVSDVDVSAMTVQALSIYYNADENVKKAVDEAMTLLSSRQLDDGGYAGFGKENCESTAQVAIAMASLGIDRNTDKRFIKNGNTIIDGILNFRLEDGSYCHIIDGGYNFMATVQAMMAFVSYERMENGKTPFYSIRKTSSGDVTVTLPSTSTADTASYTQTTLKPTITTETAALTTASEPYTTDAVSDTVLSTAETTITEITSSTAVLTSYTEPLQTSRGTSTETAALTVPETETSVHSITASVVNGLEDVISSRADEYRKSIYKFDFILAFLIVFAAATVILAVAVVVLKRQGKAEGALKLLYILLAVFAVCTVLLLAVKIAGGESKNAEIRSETVTGVVKTRITFESVAEKIKSKEVPSDGTLLELTDFEICDGDTAFYLMEQLALIYGIPAEFSDDGEIISLGFIKNGDFGVNSKWRCVINDVPCAASLKRSVLKSGDYVEFIYM